MSFSNHGRFCEQARFLRRQFLQGGELLFTDGREEFEKSATRMFAGMCDDRWNSVSELSG